MIKVKSYAIPSLSADSDYKGCHVVSVEYYE